ncbi:MAG: protein O-mannosyl-transferase family [Anaerolineae bacterium]
MQKSGGWEKLTDTARHAAVPRHHWVGWSALAFFLSVWFLYSLTTARGTIFGDPSEYQFIPAIWGIAHPPGYAFYTLVAGVWQRLFLIGDVAFRTNLLAGAAGAWAASRVFLMILEVRLDSASEACRRCSLVAALIGGLALAVAPDFWQHSIHANAHIFSVAITATQLWLLLRWSREGHDRWLFALAFFAGIGVTHHPITVWGLPAYALFILVQRPKILVQWKTLLPFIGCGLAGLLPWLYFPLRSPDVPFGPTDMRTWAGFFRHATAQGLRGNLFYFGLADQFDRLRVFWTLLRLQYAWPLLLLIGLGIAWLLSRRPRLALLWGLFLIGHLGFTLNSVQDVMAYLLHAFMVLAFPLGVGALLLVKWVSRRAPGWRMWAVMVGLVALPVGMLLHTFPRISLRDWDAADAFVDGLFARFDGRTEGAVLASDWEHLTPYFYRTYVAGEALDEADARPLYVTTSFSWTDAVFGNLAASPVYLTNYRRDIRDLGFRLRPEGDLWRVLEPPALEPVVPQVPLRDVWVDGRLELLGYDVTETAVEQGRITSVTLYARAATTPTEILMPFARLGTVEQRWTTDSRHLTPDWLPGEIIVERYDVYIPYTLSPGTYPLILGYTDMTNGVAELPFTDGAMALPLAEITVLSAARAARQARVLEQSLTNVGNDVALRFARARAGLAMRNGIWQEPLTLEAGQPLHLTLKWRVLARPRTSVTIFIHLVDANGTLGFGHDYTPLGGAFPSYLWFPKWLEGQQVLDPYRLVIPTDMPPGQYRLEVGMYEMGSIRRIPQFSLDGTMTGDRFILGPILID